MSSPLTELIALDAFAIANADRTPCHQAVSRLHRGADWTVAFVDSW
jgi:hypothetical protein